MADSSPKKKKRLSFLSKCQQPSFLNFVHKIPSKIHNSPTIFFAKFGVWGFFDMKNLNNLPI